MREVGGRDDALHGVAGWSTVLRSSGLCWQELKALRDLLCPMQSRGEGQARHSPCCPEAWDVGWDIPVAAS